MLWILHSTGCNAELRCTMYNVIFNHMNVYRYIIFIGYIALVLCVCAMIRIIVLYDIVLQ